jgi:hypothetical protein
MNEIAVVDKGANWHRLKSLVLDSVSSPITKRVYNLGLDEFFAWYGQEPRPGFSKATVAAWRVALEARGLGAVSTVMPLLQTDSFRLTHRNSRPSVIAADTAHSSTADITQSGTGTVRMCAALPTKSAITQ